jgi:predicted Zn-dependent protease with MMP-like domain
VRIPRIPSGPLRVPPDEFDALVEQAMTQLPTEFAELIDNVVIVVEEEPDPEVVAQFDDWQQGEELLGLYQGVPLTERETGQTNLPDQVSLYRGPLLRLCRTRRELIREVRDTLVHELGHYFGLSDEEMPY